jgi:hypothetical protein
MIAKGFIAPKLILKGNSSKNTIVRKTRIRGKAFLGG